MARYVNRSAWAQRLLGADQHMRIRVAMTGVSALLSMVCGGLVILLAYAGFARVDLSLLWIGTLVLFNLGVLVCIRTGWTQRLDDPALTQLQIRYAILSNAAGYAWVTLGPLIFVAGTTITAGLRSLFEFYIPMARVPETMTKGLVNATVTATLLACVLAILVMSARKWRQLIASRTGS